MIRSIRLYTADHDKQRYNTVGDWFYSRGETHIVASNLENQNMEFLILIHELIEAALCNHAGISQQQVDAFDKAHEAEQDEVELGDLTAAPYRRQHCIATAVERLLAAELEVPWDEYEKKLMKVMGYEEEEDD